MVNDISVLNEWWLVSMPIPMEPQRPANGNLIDLKSHCVRCAKTIYHILQRFSPSRNDLSRVHLRSSHCVIQSAVVSPVILFSLLLQAQKPEQSVMQALESLNDSQVRLTMLTSLT